MGCGTPLSCTVATWYTGLIIISKCDSLVSVSERYVLLIIALYKYTISTQPVAVVHSYRSSHRL